MARLLPDDNLMRQLKKLDRKGGKFKDRFDKTAKRFGENKNHPSLDFKKHKSLHGIHKIVLLGPDDGRRIFIRHISNDDYLAFNIVDHDEF